MIALVLLALLPLAPLSARTTLAADGLPALTPVTSARFTYLSTIQRGDATWTAYGEGTQVAPDRVSVWSGASSRSTLATFTRIGSSLHRNDGAGWRLVADPPLGPTFMATLGAQIDALQQAADTVVRIGDATVNGVATTQYQLWLQPGRATEFVGDAMQLRSSERELLDRASYKIDLWIGQADQRLYQQRITLTIPTDPPTTVSTLLTFTGFDDPAIDEVRKSPAAKHRETIHAARRAWASVANASSTERCCAAGNCLTSAATCSSVGVSVGIV